MKTDRSIVAITGAAGGLGAAMATRLAHQGARLALIDFRLDTLEGLQAALALALSKWQSPATAG
jgi:NADP-dependent 3-hydroxy acid dehydrogenase YdfG